MLVKKLSEVPARDRDGLRSHILLQRGDTTKNNLAITWVVVAPGSQQRPHHHKPEQVYIIISGEGHMQVDDESRRVARGDLAYIPPDALHAIENIGDDPLIYLSASVPAFDLEALYDQGLLSTKSPES